MPRTTRDRGFTLLEVITAVAIFGIVAALSYAAFGQQKPRQRLNGVAVELQAMLFGARQTALATGHQVVVMIFPHHVRDTDHYTPVGRVVLYEDATGDFFTDAAAVNFASYKPEDPVAGPGCEVLDTIDMPAEVEFGPWWGQGIGAAMPAPMDGVVIADPCFFCGGADDRGAIAFQPVGTVRFYNGNSPPLALPAGGSFSITMATPRSLGDGKKLGPSWEFPPFERIELDTREVRTFVVGATTGLVQMLHSRPQP